MSTAILENATLAERELLAIVLRELRHAKAEGNQLCITIDCWLNGDGAHISVMQDPSGYSTKVAGKIRAARKKGRRA